MTSPPPPFILASGSPRRRELVGMLGLPFVVETSDVDETVRDGEPPFDYVQRLAREKGAAVAARHGAGLILSADTIVVFQGRILGKPEDEADATRMLRALRGTRHRVLTAIAVTDAATGKVVSDVCETKVWLRQIADDEIAAYVATGDPMDKAAAYAIQNPEFALVEKVVGCPANVMGLPLCHTTRALVRQGMTLPPSKPLGCEVSYGGYYCALVDEVMGTE